MSSASLFHPITWVLLMLAGQALVSAWRWTRGGAPAERGGGSGAGEWARTAYLAGIPIAAVALRVVPSHAHMGLGVPARPWLSLTAAVVIGIGTAGVISVWESDWSPRIGLARWRGTARRSAWKGVGAGGGGVRLVRQAIESELHWAFFRAAALSTSFGYYAGGAIGPSLWLALVLLGLEGWTDPAVRSRLGTAAASRPIARSAALAIASTLAFAFGGSSAGGFLAQFIGRLAMAGLDAGPAERSPKFLGDGTTVEPIVVG